MTIGIIAAIALAVVFFAAAVAAGIHLADARARLAEMERDVRDLSTVVARVEHEERTRRLYRHFDAAKEEAAGAK